MSRLLGCAVIGAGRIGAIHAQTLLSLPHVRLVVVVDPNREAAVTAAEDRLAATRLDAAFRNPEVDAVVIASPSALHADHIVAAARAGKAIFCEKPVGLDIDRAEEALAVVAETEVPFQMGFQRRYDAGHASAHARMRGLGRLEVLRLQSSEPFGDDASALRDSGGIFCDLAIHDIDLARFHGGEIDEVMAIGSRFTPPRTSDPSVGALAPDDVDTAIVTLRFASGALGVIHAARREAPLCTHRAELQCAGGRLVVEQETSTPLRVYDASGIHLEGADAGDRYEAAYVREIAAFVEAVREGRTPSPGPVDALESLRVALAATRSLREGRPVRVEEIRAAAPARATAAAPVAKNGPRAAAPPEKRRAAGKKPVKGR